MLGRNLIFHSGQHAEFDPRKYLGPARDELKKLYMHKVQNVLGSENKA
jgi:fructose-bisphosphate aldolase class II